MWSEAVNCDERDIGPVGELDDDWCGACRLDRPCRCDDQIADEEFGE